MTRSRDTANIVDLPDAKGDLYTATAADTPARLAVGNNGETLVADSSTSTGLRYQAPVNANPVLNSAMQLAQRGTSIAFNSRAGYGLDRWYVFSNPSATISQQPTGDTTNLPFIQYCMRVQRNSGNTSATRVDISQPFETVNSVAYAGKTVTLSFYARAGANYSPASNALAVRLYSGTGVDQNIYVTYTGGLTPIDQTATLTTTWQRFSYTATLNSNVTELSPQFFANYLGTAGANDYYEITGVQLEVGSVATPFKTNGSTIQQELAACMRYYQNQYVSFTRFALGFSYSTTAGRAIVPLPVAMRVPPTSISYGGTIFWYDGVGGASVGTLTIENPSTISCGLGITGSSGLTAYRPIGICGNSADAYLAFNAEL